MPVQSERGGEGGGGGEHPEGGGDRVCEPEQDPQGAQEGGAQGGALVAAERAAQRLRRRELRLQQLRLLLISSDEMHASCMMMSATLNDHV
uniref:Uncharacterized protein n=1 Tax=Triticum urartu TaxID=4572 RepID=A0A8R7V547_TRIUA